MTYEEVQTYSNGTVAEVSDHNGVGRINYHSESSDYSISYIKTTVDAWKRDKAPAAIEARLITFDELKDNLGYTYGEVGTSMVWHPGESTPNWIYNNAYWYWTMSPNEDSSSSVWEVGSDGSLSTCSVYNGHMMVRPVIVISKSALN